MMIDIALLRAFAGDCLEMVRQLDALRNANRSPGPIYQAFRCVHRCRADARVLGLDACERLAEALLQQLRPDTTLSVASLTQILNGLALFERRLARIQSPLNDEELSFLLSSNPAPGNCRPGNCSQKVQIVK